MLSKFPQINHKISFAPFVLNLKSSTPCSWDTRHKTEFWTWFKGPNNHDWAVQTTDQDVKVYIEPDKHKHPHDSNTSISSRIWHWLIETSDFAAYGMYVSANRGPMAAVAMTTAISLPYGGGGWKQASNKCQSVVDGDVCNMLADGLNLSHGTVGHKSAKSSSL